MARCSSCGGSSGSGKARASSCSARAAYARKAAVSSGRIGVKRDCAVGIGGVEQQLDLELGLFQRGLAGAVQRHPALEGLERIVEREVALLDALHELFQLVERVLEVGDGAG